MVGNTRCPKLPELKNLKKSHLLTPRVNLYLQNPLSYPLCYNKAIFFVWNLFISGFWPKPILSNQLGIFKPPRPLGIVNIQAQISGLSFGVARVLFSDFRWYDWCPQVFCFMYSNLKEKWPSWRMEEGLRPILDLYTNKYKQKPNPVKKNGTSESWLWLHFALLWADFLTRFSPVFSWIFWKRFQWNQ